MRGAATLAFGVLILIVPSSSFAGLGSPTVTLDGAGIVGAALTSRRVELGAAQTEGFGAEGVLLDCGGSSPACQPFRVVALEAPVVGVTPWWCVAAASPVNPLKALLFVRDVGDGVLAFDEAFLVVGNNVVPQCDAWEPTFTVIAGGDYRGVSG